MYFTTLYYDYSTVRRNTEHKSLVSTLLIVHNVLQVIVTMFVVHESCIIHFLSTGFYIEHTQIIKFSSSLFELFT